MRSSGRPLTGAGIPSSTEAINAASVALPSTPLNAPATPRLASLAAQPTNSRPDQPTRTPSSLNPKARRSREIDPTNLQTIDETIAAQITRGFVEQNVGASSGLGSAAVVGSSRASVSPQPPQTVEYLREAYNSHLVQTQIKTRKKSRLDQQILHDSPPALTSTSGSGSTTTGNDVPPTNLIGHVPTPSYPFPNMGHRISFSMSPQDRMLPSGSATPASIAFQPPGTSPAMLFENPDFPSPNLYEIALLLHSEPGLDAFWGNVVNIMRVSFRAERVSLVVPTDLTDLENTPWGQRACFNEADDDDLSLTYMEDNDGGPFDDHYRRETRPTAAQPGTNDRPSTTSRRDTDDGMTIIKIESDSSNIYSPVTVNVDPQYSNSTGVSKWADALETQDEHGNPTQPQRGYSGNPYSEFEEDPPTGRVFPTLQPLSYEAEALIDGAGVIRVLERGKTVVLSREYRDIQTKWERIAAEKEAKSKLKKERAANFAAEIVQSPLNMPKTPGEKPGFSRTMSQMRKRFPFPSADEFHLRFNVQKMDKSPPRGNSYEEYEQAPTSPWSQSPAPSPAIRQDPSENPFFTTPKVDEDSFNPSTMSPRYSASDHVPAIGLESAATVIHIPLIHPSLSMSSSARRRDSSGSTQRGEKRAPIAILSILSSVIPFPSNLVHCLTHIAPLIATAFSLSQAYSTATSQLSHFQYRKHSLTGREFLMESNIGREPSVVSLTSPSECTKSSPSNSVSSTPNPDPTGMQLYSGSPMNSPLPTGSGVDSYFSSKQRKLETKQRTSGAIYGSKGTSGPSDYSRIRPPMSRGISEVMSGPVPVPDKKDITSAPKSASSSFEGAFDAVTSTTSTTSSSQDTSTPSDDLDTPKAMNAAAIEAKRQAASLGLAAFKLDLSQVMQKGGPSERLSSIALPSPTGMPLPSSVPATPYDVPLPPTPLFPPGSRPSHSLSRKDGTWSTYGYENTPAARRGVPPNKIKFPPSEGQLEPAIVSTPLVPSATSDLSTVQEAVNDSSYPMSTPAIDETSVQTTIPSSEPGPPASTKTFIARKKLTRRHSSGQGSIYQHTRLHSYGADFGTSFQSIATVAPAEVTAAQRYDRQKSTSKPAYTPAYNVQQSYMPPPSNKLLRTIIDAIPVHVFTAAPHTGETTWVNSRMLSYRGATAQEFMKDPYEPMHPDDRETYVKLWMAAVRKGEPFSYQIRIRRFDGNYRWFMIRAVPLRDNRGIIVHWFGTNMDIHDQRLAEVNAARQAEMAESESKYRSLANSSPQIVFAATASYGITFANNQWLEYSGQTLEESLHLGFMEAVHPMDRFKCSLPGFTAERIRSGNFEKAKGAWFSPHKDSNAPDVESKPKVEFLTKSPKDAPPEAPFSTELRLKNRAGAYRWHLVRCVSVEAHVEGLWFGTCTDIHDHKLLEQKLKEANEAAQKSMESKTRFLSNMSHEIRTPLIGISGMVNFLLDTPLNGEQLDYCHTISSSSDGLLMVINDILDLSKVEAGMMRLTSEWFRVRSLVEDANELLSTMAISKELELNYLVEDDVPVTVSGDRIRLRQVLLNIVGNAIKFTNSGEVFTRCFLIKDDGLAADQVMLGFECHDTGPGFDKKEEELMFKPFSQIDGSSTRAHGGSGLGLVISRQLVELHGGKMTATSEKGQGSTFSFSAVCKLPAQEEAPGSVAMTIDERAKAQSDPPSIKSRKSDSSVRTTPSLVFSEGTGTGSVDTSPAAPGTLMSITAAMPLPQVMDPNTMRFALPIEAQKKALAAGASPPSSPITRRSAAELDVGKALTPPMFSILIISSHKYSRLAISHHIKMTLPGNIPNQITVANDFAQCQVLVDGDDPVVFTHIVINLQDVTEIIILVSHISNSPMHSLTTVVLLTTPMQRTTIIESDPAVFEKMGSKVQFIYKPIKPSRLGVIFDPTKERDASMDRYRHTAQQVVESQKAVFTQMEKEVGNKGHRVLLVEDNRVNQKVLLRFLGRVGMEVDTASDGEECVNMVLKTKPGYYGLVLCDLHMPRKDGFAACAEIRAWEKEQNAPLTPIIALSANVMADVAERCAAAGFSRYVSKPVDFKVLGNTIQELLDPTKMHGLMEQRTPPVLKK